MKALEKDRNRRYKTADAFSADIVRHLMNEPVEARPPSAGYRLSRFYQRNRMVVGVAAIVLVIAICAASATTAAWLRSERTVHELGESAYRRAVLAAIAGDSREASIALDNCRRCDLPERRINIIEALLAINEGHNDKARKLATISWKDSQQAGYSDQIAACSLLATANCFAGFDDISFQHLGVLRGLRRNKSTQLDSLFIAYANIVSDPQACLDELDTAPDIKASPIGLMMVSLAETLLGATSGDSTKLNRSIRDNEYVRLHFRNNQLSLAYSIQAYAIAIAMAKAEGRREEANRLESEALPFAETLARRKGFHSGFYNLWMFYKAIGEDDKAFKAIRRVGDHPGTYSFFLSAEVLKQSQGPEAVGQFDAVISDEFHDSKYIRLAKAHLVRGLPDGESQVKQLAENCLEDPSPLIRRFALMAMCLVCDSDEIESLAKRGRSRHDKLHNDHDTWGDEACIQYLAGECNEDELREAIEANYFGGSMIELTIAMRHLAAGNREFAKKHFQRCVDLKQIFTFDYGFADAYLARMADPEWPRWMSSNHEM
jgi:tetratricopeptide (TPR) repeat protein